MDFALGFTFGCGGLLATTFTARSKRAHASGSNSISLTGGFFVLVTIDPNRRRRIIMEAIAGNIGPPESFRKAIGEAIEHYSRVEFALAHLLQEILKTKPYKALVIFKAVQNTRSRSILFGELLSSDFDGKLDPHWAECAKFLGLLAKFRNALVHWHPQTVVYKNGEDISAFEASFAPMVPSGERPIREADIPNFLNDCRHIRAVLGVLTAIVRDGPESLPDKFQIRPIRQNLAVLQPIQKPKAQKPPRPPSVPKLSAAQRRAKAAKDARTKGQPKP